MCRHHHDMRIAAPSAPSLKCLSKITLGDIIIHRFPLTIHKNIKIFTAKSGTWIYTESAANCTRHIWPVPMFCSWQVRSEQWMLLRQNLNSHFSYLLYCLIRKTFRGLKRLKNIPTLYSEQRTELEEALTGSHIVGNFEATIN